MRAKEHLKKIQLAPDLATGYAECIVDLMQEVNTLLEARNAYKGSKLRLDTVARCCKDINGKWKAIYRQTDLPPTLENWFLEACVREWPQLEHHLNVSKR